MVKTGAAGFYEPVPWKDATSDTVLPLGVGIAVVLGFGAAFSVFTTLLVFLDQRFGGTSYASSEVFNTAGRAVKTGLTASVIVSQWTWAATLLQSSNVAWQYGISGPFWYAAGASIQVLLFGILAIEIKVKAPTAHTYLEFIDARWGRTSHKVFMVYAIATSIIVTSMLLLGGAAVVNALTGLDLNLASFLIPWGVILYTWAGGLKATFLASYIHTAIIMICLVIFVFTVYAGRRIGDAGTMYDLLEQVVSYPAPTPAEIEQGFHSGPVDGNRGGSHLTMLSREGLFFGIINIIGNFGTVFCDQAYWQSAIAAKPSSSHTGYMLGGLVWFAIPFSLATSLGLAATALTAKLSPFEANSGLVPPASAILLLGEGGAVMILIMLFMAITSTGSAECIAVSSIAAYDIYRTYMNPDATGKQILNVSRIVVFAFGAVMGVLSIILNEIGLSLGWVYLFMGILIGSAVIPVALCLTWSRTNGRFATIAPIVGTVLALISWLVAAELNDGAITIGTLGGNVPMLTGNLFAIFSSGIITVFGSLLYPMHYDFESMKAIKMVEDEPYKNDENETDEKLEEARQWIVKYGWVTTLILIVGWPVATVSWGVFPKALFALWSSITVMWGLLAALVIVILPIYESRDSIVNIMTGIFGCQKAGGSTPRFYGAAQ